MITIEIVLVMMLSVVGNVDVRVHNNVVAVVGVIGFENISPRH